MAANLRHFSNNRGGSPCAGERPRGTGVEKEAIGVAVRCLAKALERWDWLHPGEGGHARCGPAPAEVPRWDCAPCVWKPHGTGWPGRRAGPVESLKAASCAKGYKHQKQPPWQVSQTSLCLCLLPRLIVHFLKCHLFSVFLKEKVTKQEQRLNLCIYSVFYCVHFPWLSTLCV